MTIKSDYFDLEFHAGKLFPKENSIPPCLRLQVVMTSRNKDYPLIGSEGKCYVEIGPERYFLGTVFGGDKREISRRGSNLEYLLELPKTKIDKIEELRNEEDLSLILNLRLKLTDKKENEVSHVKFDDIRADIPRSKWLDILREVGYNEYVIIAIPSVEKIPYHEKLENAMDHLEDARQAYRNRDPVHNHCRKAVKSVRMIISEISDQISGDKGERVKSLLSDAEHLFSIGSHSKDESWTGEVYGRDRELGLVITAQVVKYTAETLTNLPEE